MQPAAWPLSYRKRLGLGVVLRAPTSGCPVLVFDQKNPCPSTENNSDPLTTEPDPASCLLLFELKRGLEFNLSFSSLHFHYFSLVSDVWPAARRLPNIDHSVFASRSGGSLPRSIPRSAPRRAPRRAMDGSQLNPARPDFLRFARDLLPLMLADAMHRSFFYSFDPSVALFYVVLVGF